MIDITAAILANTEPEFDAKIGRVAALNIPVQVDVIDGVFVPNVSWAPAGEMRTRLRGMVFDAHLMVSDPEHAVPLWIAAGARRVYFHAEATKVEGLIVRSMPESTGRLGITLNPDTPVSRITPILKSITNVLIMSVNPGWSGQQFNPIAFDKIRAIKSMNPSLHVAVDGGITPEIAQELLKAGADEIVIGKALTDAAEPTQALREFMEKLV